MEWDISADMLSSAFLGRDLRAKILSHYSGMNIWVCWILHKYWQILKSSKVILESWINLRLAMAWKIENQRGTKNAKDLLHGSKMK